MKLLKILIGVVVLPLVALLVIGLFADGIAKSAIEAGGTHALGVDTTLDGANVGIFSGTFSLDGLAVANPDGYGGGSFLELGEGSLEVSAPSLLSDTIEVPELALSAIRVNLVQGLKGSNYGTILDSLGRFQGGSEEDKGEGKRFVVKKLTISDVLVTVAPVKELGIAELKLPIDKIELKDVGSESGKGVLLSELTGIVVESILKRATATGNLPGMIQGALGGKLGSLKGLKNAGIKALEGLAGGRKLPGGMPKGVEDAKKNIKDKLKGLIGR